MTATWSARVGARVTEATTSTLEAMSEPSDRREQEVRLFSDEAMAPPRFGGAGKLSASVHAQPLVPKRIACRSAAEAAALRHVATAALRREFVFSSLPSERLLNGHTGCVNTLSFGMSDGDVLASGGDDLKLILWRPRVAAMIGRYSTPHTSNILSTSWSGNVLLSGGLDKTVTVGCCSWLHGWLRSSLCHRLHTARFAV